MAANLPQIGWIHEPALSLAGLGQATGVEEGGGRVGGGGREECGSEFAANSLEQRICCKFAADRKQPDPALWGGRGSGGWVGGRGATETGELSQPGPAWDGRASLCTSLQIKTLLASVCYPETDFHAGLSNHDLAKNEAGNKCEINRICCKFAGFSLPGFPARSRAATPRT